MDTRGLLLLVGLVVSADAMKATADASQQHAVNAPWFPSAKWGYSEVRPGAHMFWYLEPCRHCSQLPPTSRPLVIWLQGGPGASGVGFGNFEEVGPYEIGWKPRKTAWTDVADIVFIDNPVGTGFSYVENNTLLARTDEGIATDLVAWLKDFITRHPEFGPAPLHVVCESYGGKMGLVFVRALLREQAAGGIDINFQGLALGDSWVSPVDFVASWGPLLRGWSLMDDAGVHTLAQLADKAKALLQAGNGTGATAVWSKVESTVYKLTDNVDWYNLLKHNIPDDDDSAAALQLRSKWGSTLGAGGAAQAGSVSRLLGPLHRGALAEFMDTDFRKMVGIIPDDVAWGAQGGAVFQAMAEDFMRPVVHVFDELLGAGVPITIYTGQLDLICCTAGLEDWLARSTWQGLQDFQAAPRKPIYTVKDSGDTAGFFKRHGNLQVYYIMGAGHMVPSDAPAMAMHMLYDILYKQF